MNIFNLKIQLQVISLVITNEARRIGQIAIIYGTKRGDILNKLFIR